MEKRNVARRREGFYGEIEEGYLEAYGEGDVLEDGVYKVERIVERRVKKVRLNMQCSDFLCI